MNLKPPAGNPSGGPLPSILFLTGTGCPGPIQFKTTKPLYIHVFPSKDTMAVTRLGKNHLRWCYECNLPIMESKECPVCGAHTEEIVLTPPADARPEFDYDLKLIRGILDRDYGE